MSKTIGYIVTGHWGIKELETDTNPEGSYKGVLYNSNVATLFDTRAKAKGAIKRTKKYAEEIGQDENPAWGGLKTKRVEKAE